MRELITALSVGKITEINDVIRIVNKNYKMSPLKKQTALLTGRCVSFTDGALG